MVNICLKMQNNCSKPSRSSFQQIFRCFVFKYLFSRWYHWLQAVRSSLHCSMMSPYSPVARLEHSILLFLKQKQQKKRTNKQTNKNRQTEITYRTFDCFFCVICVIISCVYRHSAGKKCVHYTLENKKRHI